MSIKRNSVCILTVLICACAADADALRDEAWRRFTKNTSGDSAAYLEIGDLYARSYELTPYGFKRWERAAKAHMSYQLANSEEGARRAAELAKRAVEDFDFERRHTELVRALEAGESVCPPDDPIASPYHDVCGHFQTYFAPRLVPHNCLIAVEMTARRALELGDRGMAHCAASWIAYGDDNGRLTEFDPKWRTRIITVLEPLARWPDAPESVIRELEELRRHHTAASTPPPHR